MNRRDLIIGAVAVSAAAATITRVSAATSAGASGYLPVNGLQMYYEAHGPESDVPLILVHGAFSATGSSFGSLIPALAQSRKVISLELQGHGRTADIERDMTFEVLADDIAGALAGLDIKQADLFGYSIGGVASLQVALRHPKLLRKLIMASVSYHPGGMNPGVNEMMAGLKPEMMAGSPWEQEYKSIAPQPENFPILVERVKKLNASQPNVPDEAIRKLVLPALLIVGDSDIMSVPHVFTLYQLLGGGVPFDQTGVSRAQLAVLPGTSHPMVPARADLLDPILRSFLDAPVVTDAPQSTPTS